MRDWRTSLRQSSETFEKYFRPILSNILPGRFIAIETVVNNEIAKELDYLAGIDYFYIDDKGIKGVSSRIQFSDKCWHTFTVRKIRESGSRTEYEKRKYSIENGYLYPDLAFQGYINKDKVLGFAITKTKDIIQMIDNGYYEIKHTNESLIGQAEFYIIDWYEMSKYKDILIKEY